MPNELALIDPSTYVALADGGAALAAIQENMLPGEAFDVSMLTRVPTPTGGGTQWVIETAQGVERTDAIVGVLCAFTGSGVLWGSRMPAKGTLPVLVSNDLVTAHVVGEIPESMRPAIESCRLPDGRVDWLRLPMNQWGSGLDAQGGATRGRLCKEQRNLFILRPGAVQPIRVTAQPGSVKDVRKAISQLSCAYYQAVVSLTLVPAVNSTGQPYSKIVLRQVGVLPAADAALVRSTYALPIREASMRPVVAGPEIAFGADEMSFGADEETPIG